MPTDGRLSQSETCWQAWEEQKQPGRRPSFACERRFFRCDMRSTCLASEKAARRGCCGQLVGFENTFVYNKIEGPEGLATGSWLRAAVQTTP